MTADKRRPWVATFAIAVLLAASAAVAADAPAARTHSPHATMERACTACHVTASWHQLVFDHASTGFALEGRHASVACVACHGLTDFADVEPTCAGCHEDPHQAALGTDCAACHDFAAFVPTTFTHEMTAFPLWGAHGALDCVQCHANEKTFQWARRPETCYDCHATDLATTRVSVHMTAGPDCETCHTLDEWSGGHDPAWMEIRSGQHAVACSRCHKRGEDYLSHTCVDCHRFPLSVPEHVGLEPDDARCRECHPHGLSSED